MVPDLSILIGCGQSHVPMNFPDLEWTRSLPEAWKSLMVWPERKSLVLVGSGGFCFSKVAFMCRGGGGVLPACVDVNHERA